MTPFDYARPADIAEALRLVAEDPDTRFIGGGTNLVDLMKEGVETPRRLVDVSRLPGLDVIEELPDGGLRIGAVVRNSDLAVHALVRARYPIVSQALLSGASAQIRNRATTSGNLLQRTRCPYFTDPARPCNKRTPGSGCSALRGYNRLHAVLGWSEACIATHPSDLAVALTALGARVRIEGGAGKRISALDDLLRLPGDAPQRDTELAHSDLITAVDLPPPVPGTRSNYLKLRDRASYAFALVSVAASASVRDGHVAEARIALGGVAHKPWRDAAAERSLLGAPARRDSFQRASGILLAGARAFEHNAFKIPLARRAVVRALETVTGDRV
jgi:xanthine dehydrogenase YagS FAD-binding subunit